ncbi:hypothetical protein ACFX2A_013569 [Malus domestica]
MEPQCFSVVGSMAKLTSFTILLFLLSCLLLLLQIRDLHQSVEHVQDRAREVDLDGHIHLVDPFSLSLSFSFSFRQTSLCWLITQNKSTIESEKTSRFLSFFSVVVLSV